MMRRSCVDHTILVRAFVVVLLFIVVVFVTRLQAAPLDVFVAIPPQQWLARQLGGEFIHSQVLLDQGQEPHSYEPSPKQITALFHSRLYCTMGLAFEREIVRKLRLTGGPLVIDTIRGIKQIPIGGPSSHGTQAGFDPHVWLTPDNLKIMAGNMTEAFCQSDPEHRVVYRHRYNDLVIVLDSLDQAIHTLLDPCYGAAFYVFHPAFGYFAHAYGLRQKAVELAGKSPGPRRLHSLVQQAVADGAKVIFVQPQFDPRSCRAIAMAIGGVVIPLDPLASDVVGNLKMMAESIHQALTATGPK